MSLSSRSATRTKSAIRDRVSHREALQEIQDFLDGCYELRSWDLSQEEADAIVRLREELGFNRSQKDFEALVDGYRAEGKSAGARYIAARIFSGAAPDLRQLTQDWFAHRNIKRELSADELKEIGASPMNLRMLGIQHQWEARKFYGLYREVMDHSRVWGSSCQVNQGKVKALALTPNYNRLPMWVKKVLINSPQWIETERVGDIWRLINCAKAWKHAPHLPKKIAEKIGRMSPKSRILADWAWEKTGLYCGETFGQLHQIGWECYGEAIERSELETRFWLELRRLQGMSISALIAERHDDDYSDSGFSAKDHNRLRSLSEIMLEIPYGFLFEAWGRHKHASLDHYLEVVVAHGTPEDVCRHLFGNAGPRTVQLFKGASQDAWKWASAICDGNADAVQKVLAMREIISYQTDAVEFLRSLSMSTRIRLLGATTFKYRGVEQPISDDHVRDTGYLWKNIEHKPELGRIRCWFSVHEQLSAAFVKELPDEVLPIPAGWERVDGLCAVDGSWTLELPKRVATLKYYGEFLRNCVGGYGPAIKSGRSVVFVVREHGILTHCVEVCGNEINQFYRSGNSDPDWGIRKSVESALEQARLIDSRWYENNSDY